MYIPAMWCLHELPCVARYSMCIYQQYGVFMSCPVWLETQCAQIKEDGGRVPVSCSIFRSSSQMKGLVLRRFASS